MLRLRLSLCFFLLCQCFISLADEAPADGDKTVRTAAHRQGKYAGRAGNYASLNNNQKQNLSQQNPTVVGDAQERKALTKEERRALRRQVNESVSSYPLRR